VITHIHHSRGAGKRRTYIALPRSREKAHPYITPAEQKKAHTYITPAEQKKRQTYITPEEQIKVTHMYLSRGAEKRHTHASLPRSRKKAYI
jgi:UDP-N-acetylmuramyl pentapeptide synthase